MAALRLFPDYAAAPTARERAGMRASNRRGQLAMFDGSAPTASTLPQQPTPVGPTYRERRAARAARLRDWADKRETRGAAALNQADTMAAAIPLGQPILIGHHSERRDRNYRNRIDTTARRGLADLDKAREMNARADEIERQAAHAIYNDDTDAADRLRERIADLEAQRDRIKAYNATCRKGSTPDLSILDDRQRAELASVQKHTPYNSKGGRFPGYALSNLSGNISRQRKRLADLEQKEQQ